MIFSLKRGIATSTSIASSKLRHFRLYSSDASDSAVKKKLTARESTLLDEIIRVDHAGEFGANQIYAGQMAVLGKTKSGPVIEVLYILPGHTLMIKTSCMGSIS